MNTYSICHSEQNEESLVSTDALLFTCRPDPSASPQDDNGNQAV